ncbi:MULTISPECIES: hypothetical protein [unclassified Mesorhizobium]|uniref:hypothetical protein n=1 Tax=unclassified Mesorhizobium TaxID=325217 RepID=UPI001FE0C6F2|nr:MULTISPECIES: hypothetical protein [unclassified Mesorhizobium]
MPSYDSAVRPLNSDGHLRGLMYHDARLQMLHDRVINRMERVDHLANEVEQAAAMQLAVPPSTRSLTTHSAIRRRLSFHLEAGQLSVCEICRSFPETLKGSDAARRVVPANNPDRN